MASRKEQKEQLRAERERKAEEAAAAERRKRMIGFGAAGAIVAAALAAIVIVVIAGGGDDGGEDHNTTGESRGAEPTDDFPNGTIPEPRFTNLEQAPAPRGARFASPRPRGAAT
jgi:hypothetical protein